MKFNGIDMKGKFHVQRVPTKPSWQVADAGRIIYVEDERMLYYASDEMWLKSAGSGFNPIYVDSDYTSDVQDLCLVDTRNGPVTITLPPIPKDGGEIKIVDTAGTFESNPCTLHRNGSKIQRHDKDLVLDINDLKAIVTYDKKAAGGWKVELTGVSQIIGHATIFVHKKMLISENIDGEGGQKQFTFPFKVNPSKDNIAVYIQGIRQEDNYEITNPNSITFNQSVKAGLKVHIASLPIEAGINIDKFATLEDLDRYVLLEDFTDASVLSKLKNVDGHGSGLDADLLDGREGTTFVYIEDYEDTDVLRKIKNVDGHGSGLDADVLDGWHAKQTVTAEVSTRAHKIPVARENGTIDTQWLPFRRGGVEWVNKFDIPAGNPNAIDIMDLDNTSGHLIYLRNIVPTTDNVKLYLKAYNETDGTWTTIDSWTVHFSDHLTGVKRDFNTKTDMMLANHVGTGIYGLNGVIHLTGFSKSEGNLLKTIKTDLQFYSSVGDYASLYQGIGSFPNNTKAYSGIRIYFDFGDFIESGSINILKINDTLEEE